MNLDHTLNLADNAFFIHMKNELSMHEINMDVRRFMSEWQ